MTYYNYHDVNIKLYSDKKCVNLLAERTIKMDVLSKIRGGKWESKPLQLANTLSDLQFTDPNLLNLLTLFGEYMTSYHVHESTFFNKKKNKDHPVLTNFESKILDKLNVYTLLELSILAFILNDKKMNPITSICCFCLGKTHLKDKTVDQIRPLFIETETNAEADKASSANPNIAETKD